MASILQRIRAGARVCGTYEEVNNGSEYPTN